jgi:2-polyprenyl-6-methoxyphenol hydroxylase-like FAD-dependent oxidoreductase
VKVIVLGAGVAGLCSALALARGDHQVIVFERDTPQPPDHPGAAPQWERPGVPHFLQPHAFLSRGVKELRQHAPDVYQALVDEGAEELQLFTKMPEARSVPDDEDLLFLGCRRALIEWVLRRVVTTEPNIELRSGAGARGLTWEKGSAIPRASGVVTTEGAVSADLVVDAMGRSSPLSDWIVEAGGVRPSTQADDCGTVYYSRYFCFRPGLSRPEGPWLLGPRAELGYLETGTFWGDNRTFAFVQQIAANDKELRMLRHADKYMASLRSQGAIAPLIDDEISEPITPVLPMGQLRNTLKEFVMDGGPVVSGVIAVGDSRCHTNPRYAWGLSLALGQGFLLADLAARNGKDAEALALAFDNEAGAWTSTVFRTSVATDAERKLYWSGVPTDLTTPTGSLQLFLLMMFPVAGTRDPHIFRKAVRRLMLLDDPKSIEADREVLDRAASIIEEQFAGSPPPRQGPPRPELIKILQSG